MLTEENVREIWDSKVKSTFDQYLKIKNVSPAYSPTWKEDGYMDEAINLFEVEILPNLLKETIFLDQGD